MRRFLPLIVGVLLIALAASSPHVQAAVPDPDSPAGVEYALPLDQARRDARRDQGSKRGGRDGGSGDARNVATPLFGAGISKGGGGGGAGGTGTDSGAGSGQGAAGSSGRGGAKRGSGGKGARGHGQGSSGGDRGSAGSRAAKGTNVASVDGGGSSKTGMLVAVVAGVLLLGAMLGLALRRVMGRRST